MKYHLLLLAVIMPALVLADFDDAPVIDGQWTLTIEHSLDEGVTYKPRGTVEVTSLRSKSSTSDQVELSAGEKSQLKELCAQNGLYLLRIQAQSKGSDGTTSTSFNSVAEPCGILASGLADILSLHMDWRAQLVGISIQPSPISGAGVTFRSKVSAQQMETGPSPDTAAFIQKVEQEKLAQQRGETKDNRSFFAKYWMYIVPVVLVMAMSGGNPEGGAGGR